MWVKFGHKSTVNGDCGSLGDNSVGSSKHKFWPFVGKKSSDVAVDLTLSDGSSWRATISGTKPSVSTFSTTDIPEVKVWRRKQLMDLINAAPAKRFEVIAEFIDVAEITASEKVIRDLQRNISQKLSEAARAIIQSESTLVDQCRIAGGDETKVLDWAATESKKQESEFDDEIGAFSELSKKLDLLVSCINTIDELREAGASIKQNLDEAADSYPKAKSSIIDGAVDTLALLSEAKKYFDKKITIDACPFCESTENTSGLPERVSGVLDAYTELTSSEQQFQQVKNKQDEHKKKESEQVDLKEKRIEELVRQLHGFMYKNDILHELNNILEDQDCLDGAALNQIHSDLIQHKDSLIGSKRQRDSVEAAYNQYQTNLESQKNNSVLKPKIDRLLEIHEEKRKAFIDDILASIANEVGRLYEAIHPGEGLNNISLQLDPNKLSSLDVQSKFLNKDAPPGAYFSNSHLDSLGLCILFALAKRDAPENTILILDDVLGSIDEPHAERIIRLIYD